MTASHFLSAILLLSLCSICIADGPEDNQDDMVRTIPPPGTLSEDDAAILLKACQKLRSDWSSLQSEMQAREKQSDNSQALQGLSLLEPEVLVFPRAVELAVEYRQFYRDTDVDRAFANLEEAKRRLQLVSDGATWEEIVGIRDGADQQLVIGGFRSEIDESIQPYAMVLPPGLSAGDSRPRRLDIWFHGRGERESEMHFLAKHAADAGIYQPVDTIVLHPYGRYSNAFRFAGEQDVFEALAYIRSKLAIDRERVSVRGFSMGGAACWQFATRYPDQWFAANPGAGFSETVQFLKFFQGEDVLKTAPAYQQKLWTLYDSPPVAINLTNCPTVVYSGEIDRQKQAADVMETAMAGVGMKMLHVIGPNTAHKIHADSQRDIESRMASLANRGNVSVPHRFQFATHSLHHNKMHWITLEGLQQHWNLATVKAAFIPRLEQRAARISLLVDNVSSLTLSFRAGQWPGRIDEPTTLEINGHEVAEIRPNSDYSFKATFRAGETWQPGSLPGLQKSPGRQGPIDDAFTRAFVFVLPTGVSSRKAFQEWCQQEALHAMQHWRQHFRGDIRSVKDINLTEEMMATKNLILFGDEESNVVIRRISDDLPLTHASASVLAQQDAEHTALAMIYPNPLNTERYVVLNSGFTYREYDYLNNARQTPKLPDWAVFDVRRPITARGPQPTKAGFFGERWELK